jgi:hypothetical protein
MRGATCRDELSVVGVADFDLRRLRRRVDAEHEHD